MCCLCVVPSTTPLLRCVFRFASRTALSLFYVRRHLIQPFQPQPQRSSSNCVLFVCHRLSASLPPRRRQSWRSLPRRSPRTKKCWRRLAPSAIFRVENPCTPRFLSLPDFLSTPNAVFWFSKTLAAPFFIGAQRGRC